MASVLKYKNRMHRKKKKKAFPLSIVNEVSTTQRPVPALLRKALQNRFLCTFRTLRNSPEITICHVESTPSKIRCSKIRCMFYGIRTPVRPMLTDMDQIKIWKLLLRTCKMHSEFGSMGLEMRNMIFN